MPHLFKSGWLGLAAILTALFVAPVLGQSFLSEAEKPVALKVDFANTNGLEKSSSPAAVEKPHTDTDEHNSATNQVEKVTNNALATILPEDYDLLEDAQRLFSEHSIEEAETKYLELYKRYSANPYILANLGAIELEMQRLDVAEMCVNQALAADTNDVFSLDVLGRLKYKQGHYDEALDILSRAAQLDPTNAEVLNFLGVTLSRKGQNGPAATALRKAIQIEPDYGSAHNNLAVVYVTQKPPLVELARWHYRKAMKTGFPRNLELEQLLELPDIQDNHDKP